jgi:hypothetical protein
MTHSLGGRPCRDCGAPMIWARWADSGKGIPLNAEPDPERGNLVLHSDGTVEKVTYLAEARKRGDDLYVTHFATCPAADSFRKS